MAVKGVLWTQRSLKNLEAELDYYGAINPILAKELSSIINESVEKIKHLPGIGRSGKHINTREFVLSKYPYIMVYRVRHDILEILTFIHQKRKNIQSYY